MKKTLITLLALSFVVTSSFAKGFFDHRVFEAIFDVPVQVTNNYFKITDFQKDADLVIDLRDMADSLPNSGYRAVLGANPQLGINLNTKHFSSGVFAGLDLYGNVGIGKEFFDFLGYGNQLNEDIEVDADAVVDAFLTVKAPVTVDIRRIRATFQSNAFIPIISANASNLNATIKNTADGRFVVNGGGVISVGTILDYNLLFGDDGVNLDPSVISGVLSEGLSNNAMGLDFSGAFDYRFSDILMLTTNFNIPLVPGKLIYETPVTMDVGYETSVIDMISQKQVEPTFTFTPGECKSSCIRINRPLKLNAGVEYSPLETNSVILAGKLGFGVRHPFSKSQVFYPEYDFEARFSLANILKCSLSTAYTDQIFSHQFAAGLNIRLVEINAGISTQSSTLAASFQKCGVGAFVNVAVGM